MPRSCYINEHKTLGRMFVCGNLGPHCAECADVGDHLCDYPVGKKRTCDRPLCELHANEIAPNLHYCAAHLGMWNAYRQSCGVQLELDNVVPYRGA